MKKLLFLLLIVGCSKIEQSTPTPKIEIGEKIEAQIRFDEATLTIKENNSHKLTDGYIINFNVEGVSDELINVYLIDTDTTFLGSFKNKVGIQNIHFRGSKLLTKPFILCTQ